MNKILFSRRKTYDRDASASVDRVVTNCKINRRKHKGFYLTKLNGEANCLISQERNVKFCINLRILENGSSR